MTCIVLSCMHLCSTCLILYVRMLSRLTKLYHMVQDSAILAYVILSTQLRPLYLFPTVRSFALCEPTQQWCSVTFSDKTAEKHQCTENDSGLLPWRSNKQLRLQIEETWLLLQRTEWYKHPCTVHLKNVQHSSMNARRYILQTAHKVACMHELCFCNALYIMYISYMYSKAFANYTYSKI